MVYCSTHRLILLAQMFRLYFNPKIHFKSSNEIKGPSVYTCICYSRELSMDPIPELLLNIVTLALSFRGALYQVKALLDILEALLCQYVASLGRMDQYFLSGLWLHVVRLKSKKKQTTLYLYHKQTFTYDFKNTILRDFKYPMASKQCCGQVNIRRTPNVFQDCSPTIPEQRKASKLCCKTQA